MLADTLQPVVTYIVNISFLAIFIAGLVGAGSVIARIPARTTRKMFERHFSTIRRRHYFERGMNPSRGTLRRELRRASNELFSTIARSPAEPRKPGLPFWFSTEPWPFDIPANSIGVLGSVFPDLKPEYLKTVADELRRLEAPVESRLKVLAYFWSFLLAAVFAHGWQINSLDVLSGSGNADGAFGFAISWKPIWSYYALGSVDWSLLAGVWISTIVATLISALFIRRPYRRAFGLEHHHPVGRPADAVKDKEDVEETDIAPLGEKRCAVRTLSFAGGAFDTVMQIGVAHALLTIQGRAPDAAVGISGGAANAVAVAEVMQAGEEHEKASIRDALGLAADTEITKENIGGYWERLDDDAKCRIQRQRQAARVDRLRACIEAAQQAPEKLFDALLPDPYQIDSTNPLSPLEQPRFSNEERAERANAAVRRTGLVSLYNDILNVPFSIGILARALRRLLGIKAAGEIRNFSTKLAVKIVEGIRLWVLLGINLIYAAPLVRVLLRVFRSVPETTVSTAGMLIFRFRFMSRIATAFKNTLVFLFLLTFWVSLTLLPLTIGVLFALFWSYWPLVTVVLYLLLIVPSLTTRGGLTQFERSTVVELIKGASKTGFILLLLTVCWSAVWAILFVGIPVLADVAIDGWDWSWSAIDWAGYGWYVLAWSLISIATVAVLVGNAYFHQHTFGERLLRCYRLNDAILRVHGLQVFLADLFDPGFFRKPSMDDVVEESLKDRIRNDSSVADQKRKLIGDYSSRSRLEPMHVGVSVANTSTGKLEVLDRGKTVVDALVAALSAVPLFRAVELDGQLYVNGSNVANEPTRALLGYLRQQINDDPGPVHIYSVSPFPMSQAELGQVEDPLGENPKDSDEGDALQDEPKPILNLVDVAFRALNLQRFRDATMERRLTELISRVLRPGDNQIDIDVDIDGKTVRQRLLRVWVTPIELDASMNFNAKLIGANKTVRRRQVLQTISDGCRASMQVMMGDAIKEIVQDGGETGDDRESTEEGIAVVIDDGVLEWIAPCASAVRRHLKSRLPESPYTRVPLPGSREGIGPGLSEVCRYCRIWRDEIPGAEKKSDSTTNSGGDDVAPRPQDCVLEGEETSNPKVDMRKHNVAHLRQKSWWSKRGPAWPHEREYRPDRHDGDPHFERELSPHQQATLEALKSIQKEKRNLRRKPDNSAADDGEPTWPRPRSVAERTEEGVRRRKFGGTERTTVSFLFSGGVFRGVYQMGVLTALDQLNLKPDVIAGASVGSITAAMIAETFSIRERRLRHARIAQLAAVYLAIDRIILTDRFADFVRDLTLRAADTQFSIRQADRLFRKYDHPDLMEFDRNARTVVAGLERLLYINPYQLNEFVKSVRTEDYASALAQIREFGQQVLDRMFVGDEVLGADALKELIDAYVTAGRTGLNPVGLQFDDLRRQAGIQFLATTTNLTQGRLEILGESPGQSNDRRYLSPILDEGLLASSAFPGVFRPRWSWELYPDTDVAEQYIDGGVMDNLPLDAVAQFLHRASLAKLIKHQPDEGPHLIVAASLEVNAREYSMSSTRKGIQESWLKLRRRTRELKYNTKLDIYRQTQNVLRRVRQYYQAQACDDPPVETGCDDQLKILDLEVLAVKPNLLCDTFAFHPMLGFKRQSQKESIAHGCASTLLKFGEIGNDPNRASYLDAWRVRRKSVPPMGEWSEAFERLKDKKELSEKGLCWLTERPCPFAAQSLKKFSSKNADGAVLKEATISEVSEIYTACMETETHLRRV